MLISSPLVQFPKMFFQLLPLEGASPTPRSRPAAVLARGFFRALICYLWVLSLLLAVRAVAFALGAHSCLLPGQSREEVAVTFIESVDALTCAPSPRQRQLHFCHLQILSFRFCVSQPSGRESQCSVLRGDYLFLLLGRLYFMCCGLQGDCGELLPLSRGLWRKH